MKKVSNKQAKETALKDMREEGMHYNPSFDYRMRN
jgi:hypothetical protein